MALLLRPFLDTQSRQSLSLLNRDWRHWQLFGDCPIARPAVPYRRRLLGFGKVNPHLHIRHVSPSPYLVLHFVWEFLSFSDRRRVAEASPPFEAYARLRRSTATVAIGGLRAPRPPPSDFSGLQHDRAWRVAVALLRFDFIVGDLVRWLGGEYTNAHRDWPALCDTLTAIRDVEPYPGEPPVDFDRAYRACTDGVPLAGDYECSFDSLCQRNQYNNHPKLVDVLDDVRLKLAKEEAQSFHLALPRFLWRFLPGLHLALMTWDVRKGKGRLVYRPVQYLVPG